MTLPQGKLLHQYPLYSEEAWSTLTRAETTVAQNSSQVEESTGATLPIATTIYTNRFDDSSHEEMKDYGDDDDESESSSDSFKESENDEDKRGNNAQPSDSLIKVLSPIAEEPKMGASQEETNPKRKGGPKIPKEKRQIAQQMKAISESLGYESFPNIDEQSTLEMPSNLLTKEDRLPGVSPYNKFQSFLKLSKDLQKSSSKRHVVVLLLRSGRFAGGIFSGDKCIVHRAFQRYTIRKGQGKAQSAQDNSKRKAKSMGAQLRRAGEQSLREDIHATIREWKEFIGQACLILLSCPQAMKTTLFAEVIHDVIARDDARLRKIPFDVGRPTYENVTMTYDVLMRLNIRETLQLNISSESESKKALDSLEEGKIKSEPKILAQMKERPKIIDIPMRPLHVASDEGNLTAILDLLSKEKQQQDMCLSSVVNLPAGPDFMTPLHFASGSSSKVDPTTSAACVSALLIQGRADPTVVDSRGRVAYYLASNDKVREAFRLARAALGEEYCDWEAAKVGPALTEDDLNERKQKEAEKRRRKKSRQKEKKVKEKGQTEELERRRKEEEERKKQEDDAKRIRDGLQPRASTATNVCDFCQKVCKGKRRSQMFARLDYAYCSTDCVQMHKRELMAAAALARMNV